MESLVLKALAARHNAHAAQKMSVANDETTANHAAIENGRAAVRACLGASHAEAAILISPETASRFKGRQIIEFAFTLDGLYFFTVESWDGVIENETLYVSVDQGGDVCKQFTSLAELGELLLCEPAFSRFVAESNALDVDAPVLASLDEFVLRHSETQIGEVEAQ